MKSLRALFRPRAKAPFHLTTGLAKHGRKVRSQNNEDGIIEEIFRCIPPVDRSFIEIGIGPNWLDPDYEHGLEGNTVLLREQGWRGTMIDGGEHPSRFGVERHFITAWNINDVFRKYRPDGELDLFSLDVDGQDLWIWMSMIFQPRVVVLEYNGHFGPDDARTVGFDTKFRWNGSKYFGATYAALRAVGASKGYTVVYANGVNMFFVRGDLLANAAAFQAMDHFVPFNAYGDDPEEREWVMLDR
jgi:hypothetical protein